MNLQEFAHAQFQRVPARIRKHRHEARRLLLRSLRGTDLPEPVQDFRSRISRCGKWVRANQYQSQYGQVRQTRCNHVLCPHCGPILAAKEALRQWGKVSRCDPNPDQMSYVTVCLPAVNWSEDFRQLAEQFKNKLRYRLRDCVFAGQIQLARNKDGTAKLHLHGVCLHEGCSREELGDHLRLTFKGIRNVHVEKIKLRNGSMDTNAVNGLRYACRSGLNKGPSLDSMVRLLNAYEQIRTRGRCGLRFEIGLRRMINERTKSVTEYSAGVDSNVS